MPASRELPEHVARRRAVALAGHAGDVAFVRTALGDPDGRVRATALGALARAGALSGTDVAVAAADPDPAVRGRPRSPPRPTRPARLPWCWGCSTTATTGWSRWRHGPPARSPAGLPRSPA